MASELNTSIQDKAAELLTDAEIKAVRIVRGKGGFRVAVIRHARGRVYIGQTVYRCGDAGQWITSDVCDTSFAQDRDQAKATGLTERFLEKQGYTFHGDWQTK